MLQRSNLGYIQLISDEVCHLTHDGFSILPYVITTLTGLQVSRFCFSSEDDFVDSLLKNNVQLFLTTDINEMAQASHKGQEVSCFLSFITANCEGESWFQFTYMGKVLSTRLL